MIQSFKKTKLKPTERLVAFMLADHLNDHTGRCHPSVRLLAEETGLTVRSVITALQKLADSGYITKQETDRTGQNRHYILHPEKAIAEQKAVKDVHRCSTFTGAARSPGVVKDVHRGGEGDSPVPVKEIHLNHNESEENHKLKHKKDSKPLSRKSKTQPIGPIPAENQEECERFAEQLGLHWRDGKAFWLSMEEAGWMKYGGKEPVRDWRATMRTWESKGWMPSQKNPDVFRNSEPPPQPEPEEFVYVAPPVPNREHYMRILRGEPDPDADKIVYIDQPID